MGGVTYSILSHSSAIKINVGRAMASSNLAREKPVQLMIVSSLNRSRLASATILPSRAMTGARLTSCWGRLNSV